MASIGSLLVRLGLDVPGFQRDARRAQRLTRQFRNQWKRDFRSMRQSVFSLRNALVGLGVGIGFKKILDATAEQEAAFRQVQQAIVSTGGAAGLTAGEILKMAQSFQKVTTFGDEAILRVQSKILTFTGITKENFAAVTEAVLDMATRMEGDLNGAVVQLGKVLNDPVANLGALTRVGVQFTDAQKEMIKGLAKSGDLLGAQAIILGELQKEFGGSARAARDTFGGALAGLKNAFGDLLEAHGGLPEAQQRLERVTQLLQDPKTVAAADNLTSTMIAGFSNLVALLVPASRGIDGIRMFIDGLALSVLNAFDGIVLGAQKVEEVLGKLPGSLGAPYRKAAQDIAAFRHEIDLLRQGITATGAKDLSAVLGDPVQITKATTSQRQQTAAIKRQTTAVKKLASTQELLQKANAKLIEQDAARIWRETRTPLELYNMQMERLDLLLRQGAIDQEVFNRAAAKAKEVLDDATKKANKASDAARELGITFSSAFEDAIVGGRKFSDVLRGLAQDVLRIFIRKTVTEPLAGIFSSINFGKLLGFAEGGRPPLDHPSIVGERGPELFVPDRPGTVVPLPIHGGAASVNITQYISVSGSGDVALARAVEEAAARGAQAGYAMVHDDFRCGGPIRAALA